MAENEDSRELYCNWSDGCEAWPTVTLWHEQEKNVHNEQNPVYLNYCSEHAQQIMRNYHTYRMDIIEPNEHIAALEAQLEAVRKAVRWEVYDTGDGWRPCCQYCDEDSMDCGCCGRRIRDALGVVPPVDDYGNIVDQEAFDSAFERAQDTWLAQKEVTGG